MSEVDGVIAFDNITDRLMDMQERFLRAQRDLGDVRAKISLADAEIIKRGGDVHKVEAQLNLARGEIASLKALLTPNQLAEHKANQERADDIPF